ncbi:response regulator [Candidatus Saccharibacteria bacterium]|nr:response regulator [Candidatus Saccharibacteria bacterium]
MTKIMVVEDDQSLREIYSIRLTAEGYEIVSAGDGEEALALAVKERPDLILSDVMMPKISGFDMLDILRQTPETKNIKVIMMTALSSDDQRKRGEGLGADKYLVKSQVGIEDVIAAVHEVLDGKAAPLAGVAQEMPQQVATEAPQPTDAQGGALSANIPVAAAMPTQPAQTIPQPQPAVQAQQVVPQQAPQGIQNVPTQQPVQQPQQSQPAQPAQPIQPTNPAQ